MDAGAQGVIVPMVLSEEDAIMAVNAVKYPPAGNRGVGYSRANIFGKNFLEYKKEKTKPIIVAMIENVSSVENLEKILMVKGLDAILVGPYDLSASMNITGKFENQKFKSIITKIKILCKKNKIPCGIHVIKPKKTSLNKYIKQGFQFLPYSMDTVLLNLAIEKSFEKK